MQISTAFRYFNLFVVLMLTLVLSLFHTSYGQTESQDYAGLTEHEIDQVVEYVKTHEILRTTAVSDANLGQIIGYSFQFNDDSEDLFNRVFNGVLDYESVRDGLQSITELQATQLLKENLKQVIRELETDPKTISFSIYTFEVKKGLIDAEFARILSDDVKSMLVEEPRWQRVCLAIYTESAGSVSRRFSDCRTICPIPIPVDRTVSNYDACANGLLFPYGTDFNDIALATDDDGSSGEIELLTFFPFYDSYHESCFVNTNGIISFDGEVIQYTSDPFPLPENVVDRPLIAPFWADVDTNNGGTVYYRQMTRLDDEALAEILDRVIKVSIPRQKRFQLIWYLVATWDQVAFYGSNQNIFNTFQAVLVTDGRFAFTVFNYGDIQWTTGGASEGDLLGLGGTQAQVGFNAGNGINAFSVNSSQTPSVVDIERTSNVNIPGRYVFKIDGEEVEDYDCNSDTGSILLYPAIGSMLGGNRTEVYGPCFRNSDNVTCRFIDKDTGPESKCEYINNSTVSCVVPILLQIGRIPVFLSKDGGANYGFQGLYTSVSIDEVTENIAPKVRLDSADGVDRVVWPSIDGLGSYYDIDIFVYDDDDRNPRQMEQIVIENDKRFDAVENNFESNILLSEKREGVGIIRVSQGEEEEEAGQMNVLAISFWSDPFDLNIFYKFDFEKWCKFWNHSESQNTVGSPVSSSDLRCPCTLQNALLDRGRFSPSPRCSNGVQESCEDEEGIVHCVRSSNPSSKGHGLECCYDISGGLINIDDNLDSGYIHRYHYLGQEPFNSMGKVPYLSHFTHDVIPYRRCCNSFDNCRTYFIPHRPSDGCSGYVPPTPARMSGEPHIQTLDGLAYTFNGHGEYVLMYALNGTFLMHGRTEPLPPTSDNMPISATRFTAIAAQYDNDTKVHVTLNPIQGLVVYVTEESQWSRIDFYEFPIWSDRGITILYTEGTNTTSVSVTVAFEFGLVFIVEAANNIMSIVVTGPQILHGNCSGLLGNWNDDITDDLWPPIGDYIAANSSIREIHYEFGEKWRVAPNESVLYYPTGKTYEDYSDPGFLPLFERPNNIDQNEVDELCGDNFECIFDYQVTGNREIAKVTKTTVEVFDQIVEDLQPIVSCGFVSTPLNGSKTGSVYTEGAVIEFSCSDGFTLTGGLPSIVCTSDGVWSGSVPSCVKDNVLCDFVAAPLNGAKDGSTYMNGSIVYFTCDDGFTLSGSSSISCIEGQWSDNMPSCNDTFNIYIILYAGIGLVGLIVLILLLILLCWCCSLTRNSENQPDGVIDKNPENEQDGVFDNPVYERHIEDAPRPNLNIYK